MTYHYNSEEVPHIHEVGNNLCVQALVLRVLSKNLCT